MLTEFIITMCIIGGISIILIIEKVDNIIILNLVIITPFLFLFLFIINKIYTLSIKPLIRSSSSESLLHPQPTYIIRPVFVIDDTP